MATKTAFEPARGQRFGVVIYSHANAASAEETT
jgi:hypothetical protein